MAKMPMEPTITPRIELCHQEPRAFLVRDDEWECVTCLGHYFLDVEGKERECVTCMVKRSGKASIQLFGWKIELTLNQLVAMPPKHRVDGK